MTSHRIPERAARRAAASARAASPPTPCATIAELAAGRTRRAGPRRAPPRRSLASARSRHHAPSRGTRTVQPSRRKRRARIQRLAGGDARPCTSTTTRRRSAGGAADVERPRNEDGERQERLAQHGTGPRADRGDVVGGSTPDAGARRATRRAARAAAPPARRPPTPQPAPRVRGAPASCAEDIAPRRGCQGRRITPCFSPECALRRDGSRRFREGTSCRAPPAPPPSPRPDEAPRLGAAALDHARALRLARAASRPRRVPQRARAPGGRRARPPARRSRAPSIYVHAVPIGDRLSAGERGAAARGPAAGALRARRVDRVVAAARARSLRWLLRRGAAPRRARPHAGVRRLVARGRAGAALPAQPRRRRTAPSRAGRGAPRAAVPARRRARGGRRRRGRSFLVPLAIFRGTGFRRARVALRDAALQRAGGAQRGEAAVHLPLERGPDAAHARPGDPPRTASSTSTGARARSASSRRLTRALQIFLYREERSCSGPTLLPRRVVREQVLRDAELARLTRRLAAERGVPRRKVVKEARGYFDEMAANFNGLYFGDPRVPLQPRSGRACSPASRSAASSASSSACKRAPDRARAVPPQPLRLPDPHLHLPQQLPLAAAHRGRHQPELLADGSAVPRRRRVLHPPHASTTTSSTRWSSGSTSTFLIREGYTQEFFIEGGRTPDRQDPARRSSACCRRSCNAFVAGRAPRPLPGAGLDPLRAHRRGGGVHARGQRRGEGARVVRRAAARAQRPAQRYGTVVRQLRRADLARRGARRALASASRQSRRAGGRGGEAPLRAEARLPPAARGERGGGRGRDVGERDGAARRAARGDAGCDDFLAAARALVALLRGAGRRTSPPRSSATRRRTSARACAGSRAADWSSAWTTATASCSTCRPRSG